MLTLVYTKLKYLQNYNVLFTSLYMLSGEDYSSDPYNWNFIGKNLFCMTIEGFLYFILTILFQYRFFLDHWYV